MKQAAVDSQPINGWSEEGLKATTLSHHELMSTTGW